MRRRLLRRALRSSKHLRSSAIEQDFARTDCSGSPGSDQRRMPAVPCECTRTTKSLECKRFRCYVSNFRKCAQWKGLTAWRDGDCCEHADRTEIFDGVRDQRNLSIFRIAAR